MNPSAITHPHPVSKPANKTPAPAAQAAPVIFSPTVQDARKFLRTLRDEIALHPAVNHTFLNRVATTPFTFEDFKVYGLQHYPLVNCFTSYMENLLVNAPDSEAKRWLAKVLVDEYGEGSEGHDHSTLYLEYLIAAGSNAREIDGTLLHPHVVSFIRTHVRLTTKRPFLVGLGAIGPGHEWSIPKMFGAIVPGLRRAGFAEQQIRYFWLHQDQDEDHGRWLEEALVSYAINEENRRQIREGALLSLAARERFWSGVQEEVVRWRQPRSAHRIGRTLRVAANHALRALGEHARPRVAAKALKGVRRQLVPVHFDDVAPIGRRPPHHPAIT